MPVQFDDLSERQKAAFQAAVKKWGLTPEEVHPEFITAKLGPQTCISGDPATSQLKTKSFTINSIAHLKQMVGIPDVMFTTGRMRDRHIEYPEAMASHRHQLLAEAPSNCWLKSRLTDEEHECVRLSGQAYVVGNSSKISPAMVDMINAVHFPKAANVIAIGNVTVSPGTTHVFGTPGDGDVQVLVGGVVTIEPGGAIFFASSCHLEVQHSEVVAAPSIRATALGALADPPPAGAINIYSPAKAPDAPPKPQGPRGQQTTATTGVAHLDKHNLPDSCTTQGSPGVDGDTGFTGSTGTVGQNGVTPPTFTWHTDKLKGTFTFNCGGGNAQDGSLGGQGGAGGTGGNGIAGAGGKCNNQPPGRGGQGGQGGTGGAPGNAVNGTTSHLYYGEAIQPYTVNLFTLGGYGGKAGLGGPSGDPGSGGADPANTQPAPYVASKYTIGAGKAGDPGNGGNPGTNATFSGTVSVSQKASEPGT